MTFKPTRLFHEFESLFPTLGVVAILLTISLVLEGHYTDIEIDRISCHPSLGNAGDNISIDVQTLRPSVLVISQKRVTGGQTCSDPLCFHPSLDG